ncbi:MAG: DUF4886 domain-containing protein, partial [Thermoguttaceae bacterium]|nr:DUF4886 domain-containing protein [Thermoguttaceae bacterium]
YFKEYTYRQKISSRAWDFISIQQCSHESWLPETYFPYAENLVNFIKECAPTAEVVIQQTWAYDPSDKRLAEWNIDQRSMFEKLTDAYAKAAAKLELRVVPVGLAVQTSREADAADAPGLCGKDGYHLSRRGEYLQALVWFALLFEKPATDATFVPDDLTSEDCVYLRKIAQKAVEEYKQFEKKAE